MATLRDYVYEELYDQRDKYTGQDFVLAQHRENWIKPVPFADKTPTVHNITVLEDTPIQSTELLIISNISPVTIYRGDVFNFEECLVVLADDITLEDNTPKYAKVLPLIASITELSSCVTYAMIPVMSVGETDSIDFSSVESEANNKSQGLWKSRQSVGKDGIIELSGAIIKSDPSIKILERASKSNRSLYYESRYHPYTDFNGIDKGIGVGAYQGLVTVADYEEVGNHDNFVLISYSLAFDGTPKPYKFPPPLGTGLFYCPLNFGDFYFIDYEIIPKNDDSPYCPLDTTGFYDFTQAP